MSRSIIAELQPGSGAISRFETRLAKCAKLATIIVVQAAPARVHGSRPFASGLNQSHGARVSAGNGMSHLSGGWNHMIHTDRREGVDFGRCRSGSQPRRPPGTGRSASGVALHSGAGGRALRSGSRAQTGAT